jgi:hypothetical protein
MFLSESRHNFMILLIVFFIFIAVVSVSLWKQFTLFAFLTGILLLIDIIFLNESEYSNSPSYDHWKNLQESGLHEFDSDVSAKNKKMVFNN